MTITALLPRDTILFGDCIELMKSLPDRSVVFILTDPPYIAHFRSRDNRTVQNDDNAAWLAPSFAEMYRVLKPAATRGRRGQGGHGRRLSLKAANLEQAKGGSHIVVQLVQVMQAADCSKVIAAAEVLLRLGENSD
jgi:hypothetical protein